MKHLRIAVIGAGTAGLAAASFLQSRGNQVCVFEKFEAPKPLGAGLLLQPTGLLVLALLGLDRAIIDAGSVVQRLHGKVAGSYRQTLDVRYRDYAPHLFGVGTHRGVLFSALYDKALAQGVTLQCGVEIVDVVARDDESWLQTANGQSLGAYDLVIDASGQRSALRQKHACVALDRPYPYGALWATVRLRDTAFRRDAMEQRYQHARHMIGVLPVGHHDGEDRAAFFWSMRTADYAAWRAQPLDAWKRYAAGLWPETAPLLEQFQTHDDLTFAMYRDVKLRRYHADAVVFIGDAAHCTSPQLGQGANMALLDAYILATCVAAAPSVSEALCAYDMRRRKHLSFYQTASRMLTPLFQSDRAVYGKLRFLLCSVLGRLPMSRRIAAHVLTGTRAGVFGTLNPGEWAADYRMR